MKRLGEILIESGLLTREQLNRALITAAANRQRLGEVLVEARLLTELDVARALAAQLELEFVDLAATAIAPEALALLPRETMEHYQVIPIRLEGDRLIVATADPTNVEMEDALRAASNRDIGFVIALPSAIRWALEEVARPRLGTVLVQLGKITPKQLDRALAQAQARGRRLGEVLIEEGLLSEADVIEAVRAQSRRLGTILVRAGLLTPDQVERALVIAEASRQRLGETLVDMGLLPEVAIAHALADQLGLGMANLKSGVIPEHVIRLLPRQVASEFGVIPVAQEGDQLVVATADPTNVAVEDYLRNLTGFEITFVVAPPADIAWALERYYPARLAAVMAELTQAGLVSPAAGLEPERRARQPAPRAKDNGPSLGEVMETTADVVMPRAEEGTSGYRFLGMRLDVWLLAVTVVALVAIPCATSSLIRGRLHPLNREIGLIQAAVDAYRTDAGVNDASRAPGLHGFPTEQTGYGPGMDLVISMPMLLRAGYIRSVPASASRVNGGTRGHYIWVIESETGRVKVCHDATLTGTAVLRCAEGYNGTYP